MKHTINKKALSATLLAGSLLAVTTGCGSSSPVATNEDGTPKLNIGIIQMIDNGAFVDMREGFLAQMDTLGYTSDSVNFDYKNAQGDMSSLVSIAQNMVDSKMDAIVAIATPSAQAVVNLETDIPTFYISVSDPLGAGVITDLQHPDKNATGTSNAIPVSEMFEFANQLTPDVTTYGLIYCTSEVNSVTTINHAKDYLDANGMSYREAVVTASSEVQQATQSLIGNVDAIFCPNDSVIQSAMPQIAELAKEANLPVYGSSAVMVDSGAFATISIDDTTIGSITADMLAQYLEGTPITEIPAITVDTFTTVINQTTADAIGVSISDEILANAIILH